MSPRNTKQRTNWALLKKRYLKNEWQTLEQMGQSLKIPMNTIYKHTKNWKEARKDIEVQVEEIAKEQIIESNATILQRMLQRHIAIPDALQIKAANRLLGKVHAKDKSGVLLFNKNGSPKMVERTFDDDALALGALRFGGGVLGQLMRRRNEDPGDGGLGGMGGAIFDLDAPDVEPGMKKDKITQYSPDQLRLIIGDKSGSDPGAKKAGR